METNTISPTPPEAADMDTQPMGGSEQLSAGAWYIFRPATQDDMQLIDETWLGTWKTARAAGCIPNNMFDEVQRALIAQLLNRGMKIDVIAPSNRSHQVMGWIAHEDDPKAPGKAVVHYLFVKAPFRRRGLANTLLRHVGNGDGRFVYTHETSFARYWPRAYHNPGLCRKKSL